MDTFKTCPEVSHEIINTLYHGTCVCMYWAISTHWIKGQSISTLFKCIIYDSLDGLQGCKAEDAACGEAEMLTARIAATMLIHPLTALPRPIWIPGP